MPTSSGADIDDEEFEGSILWYDPNKGYGFIAAKQAEQGDIFLHWRHLEERHRGIRWQAGTRILFKIRSNPATGKPEAYETRLEKR